MTFNCLCVSWKCSKGSETVKELLGTWKSWLFFLVVVVVVVQRLEQPDTTFSESVTIMSHLHLAKSRRYAASGGGRPFENREATRTVTVQWQSSAQSFSFLAVNVSSAPLWRSRTSRTAACAAAAGHSATLCSGHTSSVCFSTTTAFVCSFDPAEIETAPPDAKVTCHHRLLHGWADGLKSPGGSCKSVVAPPALADVSGKSRWQEWPPVPRDSLRPHRPRLSPQAPPPPAVVGCHSNWRLKIILDSPFGKKHFETTAAESHLVSFLKRLSTTRKTISWIFFSPCLSFKTLFP